MYNLTVDEAHTFFVGDGDWLVHNCADRTPKSDIPYRSQAAKRAAKDIRGGAEEVHVPSRSDAEEVLLRGFIGTSETSPGYTNTTGVPLGEQDKWGTYHWDETIVPDEDTGKSVLAGHKKAIKDGKRHGSYRHLQIHTHDGRIIRVLYGDLIK